MKGPAGMRTLTQKEKAKSWDMLVAAVGLHWDIFLTAQRVVVLHSGFPAIQKMPIQEGIEAALVNSLTHISNCHISGAEETPESESERRG